MNQQNYFLHGLTADFDLRFAFLAAICFGFILLVVMTSNLLMTNALGQEATEEVDNIEITRQVIEAFNSGDVSNVSEFISPQYLNHESQVDQARAKLRGPEEFIDTVKNLRTAFPNLNHLEQAIIARGDIVISIVNVTGTHKGNFFILPPTGKDISYEAVHIYRIGEDGKIVEHRAIRDDLTFLAQLGVVGASSPEYQAFFEILTGTANASR